jgi:glycosyltransferase involved in cell wall biosynthesis
MQPVLFVQNHTHRAGAQTCLARLLRHKAAGTWSPVLLCAPGGWLPAECARFGIAVIEQKFPSSRSLTGRLFGNAAFVRRVARKLDALSLRPAIVHANDHIEGLLGLRLASRLGARSAIFLRSSEMSAQDYLKYQCGNYDAVIAVGEDLQRSAQSWDTGKKISLIHDGIGDDEFLDVKAKPSTAPSRILVIGNAGEAKGWGDLTDALAILDAENVSLPAFDFTGDATAKAYNSMLQKLRTECRFLGRIDGFRDRVRGYDLVINPSRNESFGMAAIEVLAAGVPLLSTRTGVIEQVIGQPDILFPPSLPEHLAATLKHVLQHWGEIDLGVEQSQAKIRERFLIDKTVTELDSLYDRLLAED